MLFSTKSTKFRSIRTHPGLFRFRELEGCDFAEFTKSEREKSAEILGDWRKRNGWKVAKRSPLKRGLVRSPLAFLLLLHSLFAVAVLIYLFV